MKKVLVALFMLVPLMSFAADNSAKGKVVSFESRTVGLHAIFFDKTIPPQGCTLSDRAIIVEADSSGKTLVSVTLSALAMNKDVVLQVDGCTIITTGESTTAPKIAKIHLFND